MTATAKRTKTLAIFSEDPNREPFAIEAGQKFYDYSIGERQEDGTILVHEDRFRALFLGLTGGSDISDLKYDCYFGERAHDWEDQSNDNWNVTQALGYLVDCLERDDWDVTAKQVQQILDDLEAGKIEPPEELEYKRFNEECYQKYFSWGSRAEVCAWDDLRGDSDDSEVYVEGHDIELKSTTR